MLALIACASCIASLASAQGGTPGPAGGMPGPGNWPNPRGGQVLTESELEQVLARFLEPEQFEMETEQSGVTLIEQLLLQRKPAVVKRIVDALATVTCGLDRDDACDGELRDALALVLGQVSDVKLQTAVFDAVRKELATRPTYLGRLFALHVLSNWHRHFRDSIGRDPSTQRWLAEQRSSSDFRVALQAWALFLADAPDEVLRELCDHAFGKRTSRYGAQVSNLILHEAGTRLSLSSKARESCSALMRDERAPWSTRREAWLTWMQGDTSDSNALTWMRDEPNPYLRWLFVAKVPRTASLVAQTRAPVPFFRAPLPTQRVVFVLDQSDSMHQPFLLQSKREIVPSELVERELRDYLKRLGDQPAQLGVVSLSIVFFAGDATAPLPVITDGHWVTSNLAKLDLCLGRNLGGGTNLYQPLHVAFRDTDADTVVFFSDGGNMLGIYSTADGIAREVGRWNRGRGTRVVTLGPKPPKLRAGTPAIPSVLQRLVEVTDGAELFWEDCL